MLKVYYRDIDKTCCPYKTLAEISVIFIITTDDITGRILCPVIKDNKCSPCIALGGEKHGYVPDHSKT